MATSGTSEMRRFGTDAIDRPSRVVHNYSLCYKTLPALPMIGICWINLSCLLAHVQLRLFAEMPTDISFTTE